MNEDSTLKKLIDKYMEGKETEEEFQKMSNSQDPLMKEFYGLKEGYQKIVIGEKFNAFEKAFKPKSFWNKWVAILLIAVIFSLAYYISKSDISEKQQFADNWAQSDFHNKVVLLEEAEKQKLTISAQQWENLMLTEANPNIKLYALEIIKKQNEMSESQRRNVLENEKNPLLRIEIERLVNNKKRYDE